MGEVIEIYREILGTGAVEIEQYAHACVEELGLTGDYSTIRYGDAPRFQVLRLFGDLAHWAINNPWFGELERIVGTGDNYIHVNPSLTVWGWDLPKVGDRAEGKPRVELSELLQRDAGTKRIANARFWDAIQLLNRVSPGTMVPRYMVSCAKRRKVPSLGIVTIDPNNDVPNRSLFKEKATILNQQMPKITLGPLVVERATPSEQASNNYGFMETRQS